MLPPISYSRDYRNRASSILDEIGSEWDASTRLFVIPEGNLLLPSILLSTFVSSPTQAVS
jgi:hypothetical protein